MRKEAAMHYFKADPASHLPEGKEENR